MLLNNFQQPDNLRELFTPDVAGINKKYHVTTNRNHIVNLINNVHSYFKKSFSTEQMAQIWMECYDCIRKVITYEKITTIQH